MGTSMKVNANEHPIKSVTIFKSGKAEIVRTFSLSLQAGQNRIEISGLSSSIDTESARVSGLGDARLFDVVCTVDRKIRRVALGNPDEEAVRILETKQEQLRREKDIVSEQSLLLSEYAETLKGEHVSPLDFVTFMQSFLTRKKESLQAVSELDDKILDLERHIAKERQQLALRKGKTDAKVSVVIVSQVDGPVKLNLTYIVSNARWYPTYELHATTKDGKTSSSVSLHYRAKIIQTTGEEWNDTALILSTTSADMMMGGIPPLSKLSLTVVRKPDPFTSWMSPPPLPPPASSALHTNGFGTFGSAAKQPDIMAVASPRIELQAGSEQLNLPPPGNLFGTSNQSTTTCQPGAPLFCAAKERSPLITARRRSRSRSYSSSGDARYRRRRSPNSDEDDWESDGELYVPELIHPVTEGVAVVNNSSLSVSYAVEGSSTIPSDGQSHKVSVAVLPFEADVTWVAMPRQQTVVYMESAVKNTSDYRLLPGPVAVFLDNSYVSRTSISDINAGDIFQCTFGIDPSARISYVSTSKVVRDPVASFVEQFKTTTFTSTTKISNQHSFPISIVSKDTVPLCDDKRIKVILRKPERLLDTDGTAVDLKREDGIKVKWGKVVDDRGGEMEGKFEWVGTIPGGKDATLVTEWEVKCPIDVDWVEDTYSQWFPPRW